MAIHTFRPSNDWSSSGNWTTVGGASWWSVLDDDPHNPDTSNYVSYNAAAGVVTTMLLGLSSPPADFDANSITSIDIAYYGGCPGWVDDTLNTFMGIYNAAGSVQWSNFTLGLSLLSTDTLRTINSPVNAAGKAGNWEDATVFIQTTRTAVMGTDAITDFHLSALEVTVAYTPKPAAITQAAYRFYADGTETGSTALAAQDAPPTVNLVAGDVNLQLRVRMQSTSAMLVNGESDFQLQWDKNNAGAWTNASGAGAGTLSVTNPTVTTSTGFTPADDYIGVISFLGDGKKLTRAGFYMSSSSGYQSGPLYFRLYQSAGVPPTTPPTVLTSSIPIDASQRGVNAWLELDFDGMFTLVNTGVYFIGFDIGEVSQGFNIGMGGNVAPSPGNHYYYRRTTSAWVYSGLNDPVFRVYTGTPSTGVVPYDSTNLTHDAATTSRLTGGTGTFTAGRQSEIGRVNDFGWAGNDHIEFLFSLTLKAADFAHNDTVTFRMLAPGHTLTVGQTPTINIAIGAVVPTGTATLNSTGTLTAVGAKVRPPQTAPPLVSTGTLTATGGRFGTNDKHRTLLSSDTFDRADTTVPTPGLGPSWSASSYYISSNEARRTAGSDLAIWQTAQPVNQDIEVDMPVGNHGTAVTGVILRANFSNHATPDDFLLMFYNGNFGTISFQAATDNSISNITASSITNLTAGPATLRFTVTGSTMRAYYNDKYVGAASDFTHPAGTWIGLYASNNAANRYVAFRAYENTTKISATGTLTATGGLPAAPFGSGTAALNSTSSFTGVTVKRGALRVAPPLVSTSSFTGVTVKRGAILVAPPLISTVAFTGVTRTAQHRGLVTLGSTSSFTGVARVAERRGSATLASAAAYSGVLEHTGRFGNAAAPLEYAVLAYDDPLDDTWAPPTIDPALWGSQGPPPWTPTDLTGLLIWLDASQLGLADGAYVDTWASVADPTLVGTNYNVVPFQPIMRTDALNSKPVVRFSPGGGLRWPLPDLTGEPGLNWTIIYVGRMWQTNPGRVVSAGYPPTNVALGFHGGFENKAFVEGWLLPDVSQQATTNWHLYAGTSEGVTGLVKAWFYSDGVFLSGDHAVTGGWGGSTFQLNGYNPTGGEETCYCEIAEVVFYDHRLPDVDRNLVEDYLRDKWGL